MTTPAPYLPPALWFVCDCESAGLFGEAYAAAYVVVDGGGREQASGRFACPRDRVTGTAAGEAWLRRHAPELPVTHPSPAGVRRAFWEAWRLYRGAGAVMAADVAWPVEAAFLLACLADDRPDWEVVGGVRHLAEGGRDGEGPYPLVDVASVRLAAGLDPLATEPRRGHELPEHDPLADSRHSARRLIEALARCRACHPAAAPGPGGAR